MASGLDAIRDQLKKIGAVDLALIGGALTSTENKFKAIGKAVKDIALFRLIPVTASLAGALVGVRGIIRDIVKESGALEAAWQRMARLRGFQNQLEPLLKSAGAARERIADLVKAANSSRFDSSQWVTASRSFEILTKGALGSAASLRLPEAAANATGGSLENLADTIGSAWRALREGQPASQAAGALEQMGLVTAETVAEVAHLQEAGASFTRQWEAVEAAIQRSTKATDQFANSADALKQQVAAAQESLMAGFGDAFTESENAAMRDTIAILNNLTPVAETVGRTFAQVTSAGEHLGGSLTRMLTSIPGLASAVGFLTKALVALGAAIVALGTGQFVANITRATTAVVGWTRSLVASSAIVARLAALLGTLATRLRAATVAAATNPFTLLATAVAAAAAAIWQWRERVAEQTAALNELKEANKATIDSLQAQIDRLRTMDDAQQAVLESTRAMVEAQAKLNALRKAGAPREQIDAQAAAVSKLAGAARAATGARDSGRLAPGAAQEEALRASAGRALELDRMQRQQTIEASVGPNRRALLESERARAAGFAAEGQTTLDERQKLAALTAEVENNQARMLHEADRVVEGSRIGEFKRTSKSGILREEEAIERDRVLGKGTPAQLAERERTLAMRRTQTEGSVGDNQKEASRISAQIAAEDRIAKARAIQHTLSLNEAKLRSEGLQRAEEEAQLRLNALEREIALLEEINDVQGYHDAKAREEAVKQQLAEARRAAGRDRVDAERGLTSREAALRGDGGTVQRLNMEANYERSLREAKQFTADPAEQAAYAKRATTVDMREQIQQSARESMVVSSLASIGGGGNAYTGIDVLKEEAKRQRELLEIIAKNTGTGSGNLTLK